MATARTVHTILLIQRDPNPKTRTFSDHETVAAAMQDIIETYQRRLKALHPRESNITYDIEELYQYIDGYTELAALVYEPNQMAYAPKDKAWIKERIHHQLSRAQRR
ncbi:enhancer of rudimentary [Thamnocephalis sphaerospora]|uniref:Enhancer of rudimentary n=1 Tax=Thamnocephalis sphaerospora TaxID=78915 RepID=A0A4P9XMW1_9FUNG|nr:enhancer of rudimentary [Thamnocephalis sphaerospora]|eukprot:RKP07258.1 enhancer of rudimentary [Thamnocephalis sphaerospora]